MPKSDQFPSAVDPPEGIGRRELLTLSSSWALVTGIGGLGGLASAAYQPLLPEAAIAPLSVGYLERSEQFTSFDVGPLEKVFEAAALDAQVEGALLDVYPAAGLPAGDPSFGWETAEITIFGLYPPLPDGWKRHVRRAALEVEYRIEDPTVGAPLSFLAWTYDREPVENTGSAIRFTAPVDRELGLSLVLHREVLQPRRARRPAAPAATTLRADFTVNLERDRPKLQRGVYLLGMRRRLFDRPLSLPSLDDPRASSYEALVLSIDHVER
jgi:hypothetical protein